jgi:acylphosphatase
MLTLSITISGKVQGVYFRQSTKEMANAIGLMGQVQNLADGSVNIVATGSKEQLDRLVDWCRKGPEKASVKEIEIKEITLQQFETFSIIRRH